MSELNNQASEQNTQDSINETGGIPEITMSLEVSGMTQTPVDKSLTISDMAADAKVTGDRFADVESDIFRIEGNITVLSARTGADIALTGETGSDSIANVVTGAVESISDMQTAITGLQAETADDIPYTSGPESPSIKETVDALSEIIEGLDVEEMTDEEVEEIFDEVFNDE